MAYMVIIVYGVLMHSPSSTISGIINFDKVIVKGDLAVVTMTLPVASLASFKAFFTSVADFSSYIFNKSLHDRAGKSEVFKEECRQRYVKRSDLIMTSFCKHLDSGVTRRQAVRLVKEDLVKIGHEVTCGLVELIISNETKRGPLK